MNRGRISTQVFLCFFVMMFLMVSFGCGGGSGVWDAAPASSGPYLYVPDAKFHQGKPPSASGNSTALAVKSAAPSTPVTTSSTITRTWTVTWTKTT